MGGGGESLVLSLSSSVGASGGRFRKRTLKNSNMTISSTGIAYTERGRHQTEAIYSPGTDQRSLEHGDAKNTATERTRAFDSQVGLNTGGFNWAHWSGGGGVSGGTLTIREAQRSTTASTHVQKSESHTWIFSLTW